MLVTSTHVQPVSLHTRLAPVHNDGVIPSALLPRLFDPFRGRERRHGDARGLVREIVRVHHGHVDVRSTADEGTTFCVRLPRDHSRRREIDLRESRPREMARWRFRRGSAAARTMHARCAC